MQVERAEKLPTDDRLLAGAGPPRTHHTGDILKHPTEHRKDRDDREREQARTNAVHGSAGSTVPAIPSTINAT